MKKNLDVLARVKQLKSQGEEWFRNFLRVKPVVDKRRAEEGVRLLLKHEFVDV